MSAVRQLQDSAASEYCHYSEQITNQVNFLTRLDTANINETSQLIEGKDVTAKPAPEQAEKAFAQLPPFEARKAFLLGAPRPACCPERAQTAEGIRKLRQTKDGEIGTVPGHGIATCILDLYHSSSPETQLSLQAANGALC